MDGRINHYGYVTGAQKNSFFDRLDVMVIPSEYEENAPIIVAEALVRGLPCVVSDRGGLPETPEAWTFRAGDTIGEDYVRRDACGSSSGWSSVTLAT